MNIVYESKKFTVILLNSTPSFYKVTLDEYTHKLTVCTVAEDERKYILHFQIIDKLTNISIDIQFEPTNCQCTSKEIDIVQKKQIVTLTTTPPRAKSDIFIKNIIQLTQNQVHPIDKLIINIPYKYLRFTEKIDSLTLNKLGNLPKVQINMLEEDYGPASKYLGTFIKNRQELFNSLLIVVDDDKFYNPYLVHNFNVCANSFKNLKFLASDWSLYFNCNYDYLDERYLECFHRKHVNNHRDKWFRGCGVAGFMGFAFNFSNKELFESVDKIINYHRFIHVRVKNSIFHDDAVMTGYIKQTQEQIAFLKHVSFKKSLNVCELPNPLWAEAHINKRITEKQIFNMNYE